MNSRHFWFSLSLIGLSVCLFGQEEINVKFYEKEISESEIRIYCDNSEFFPVLVELKLEL